MLCVIGVLTMSAESCYNRRLLTFVVVLCCAGYVGLNNLKCTDYVNVVVQALCRVKPLRAFFCDHTLMATNTSPLVHKFAELMRKLWSPRNFKSTVRTDSIALILAGVSCFHRV